MLTEKQNRRDRREVLSKRHYEEIAKIITETSVVVRVPAPHPDLLATAKAMLAALENVDFSPLHPYGLKSMQDCLLLPGIYDTIPWAALEQSIDKAEGGGGCAQLLDRGTLIERLASYFFEDNPRFDVELFKATCLTSESLC